MEDSGGICKEKYRGNVAEVRGIDRGKGKGGYAH